MSKQLFFSWYAIILLFAVSCSKRDQTAAENWPRYLGDAGISHYSALRQIDTANVGQLKLAWIYHCGDADTSGGTQIQCNPLIIGGVLYGTTPKLKLFALDAATGKEKWVFNHTSGDDDLFQLGVNRGLAWWSDGNNPRILYSAGPYLYAVDARTGKPIPSFGQNGRVDLHEGLDRNVENLSIVSTTPGIVFKDLLIIGSRVSESTGPVPGHIRAFDVRTGAQRWIFHTIPHPGEYGYDTWPGDAWQRSGGANAWSGFSLDEERGMVFAGTGSASFDFYGGDRLGKNLFANCVLALDAATGKRIWHYQLVHHDIWDRDLSAPPALITIQVNGRQVDALAQITKAGYVFLLDRETGKPLYPVEERPVQPSTLAGESAWPTQPFPLFPPPFARTSLTLEDLADHSPEAAAYAKSLWAKHPWKGAFVPPDTAGQMLFPGYDGGGEWGGAGYDPITNILYVNANNMPWLLKMDPYEAPKSQLLASRGRQIYQTVCISCHGPDRKGGQFYGNTPSLLGVEKRRTAAEITDIIRKGKNLMPSFAALSAEQIHAVTAFLTGSTEQSAAAADSGSDWPYPYAFSGYTRLFGPDGLPVIRPPWGTLTALDLNAGKIVWQIPLGQHPKAAAKGLLNTGAENYGGPVITAGGVLFIAATQDEKFRAFNKRTGQLLWETSLPAGGYATPATYAVNGQQFVVVAAGGGKLGTKSGDTYVAYSLGRAGKSYSHGD